jgi:predicted Rossmann fold nucleotide-binding protein DprA/Smf involved in DNA uptake
MAMNMKKELQSVKKRLETLSKKLEKMVAAASAPEKTKPKVTKAKPVKKIAAKKPAAKKTDKLSALETVLTIIKRGKKAVDIAALKEKTGFMHQKLHNAVHTLKKQGKIKSAGRGVYVKA